MNINHFEIRKSGISLIGDISWGTYFCQFFNDEKELMDITVPYFKAGLENNELCIWITSDSFNEEKVNSEFKKVMPDYEKYKTEEKIIFIPFGRWLKNESIEKTIASFLDKAILSGLEGLRIACNYESADENCGGLSGSELLSRYNVITLSIFSRGNMDAVKFMETVKRFQFALVRNTGRWEVLKSSEVLISGNALKRSQEKLHSLFRFMSEGFAYHRIVLDQTGKPIDYIFLEVTEVFEKLTGLKGSDIINKRATQVLPGIDKDRADWIGRYGKVALTGKPVQFENYSEQLKKWFSVSAFSPHKGYFAVTFSDITERKKSDEELVRKETELREAQRLAHIGSWYWDAETDVTTGSDELLLIYGLDPARETMPNFMDQRGCCYPAEYWEKVNEAVQGTMKTGTGYELDVQAIRKGELIWITTRGEAVRNNEGRIIGIRGTVQDIDERKKAEEKIFEARQRIQAIMDSAPVGISFSDDPNCERISGNNVLFEQFEMAVTDNLSASASDKEEYGRKIRYFVNGREIGDNELPLQRAVKENKIISEMVLEILLPSGRRWFAMVSGAPVCNKEGNILGGVAVTIDITERMKAEDVLKRDTETLARFVNEQANNLLQVRMELEKSKRLSDIGLLAATVAHELRNPLAAICMAVHNIKVKANNPVIEKNLLNIDKKIGESEQIINNLLFYSKIKPPHYERINLCDILEECVDEIEKKKKKDLGIIRKFDIVKKILIKADPLQIKEVFSNILNNSYDAIPPAGGEIKIMAEINNEYITVIIEDNGPGIDKDTINYIFDPFFTTKAKGTGLGLSVCKQIITMHEGEIGINPGFKKGTSVFVRFQVEAKAV